MLLFCELWCVFFQEGVYVFVVIVVVVEGVYGVVFQVQLFGQCIGWVGIQCGFGCGQVFGWGVGEVGGYGMGFFYEFVVVYVFLDQVLVFGLFGVDFFVQQCYVYGVCCVYQVWQEIGVVGIGDQFQFVEYFYEVG